MDHPYKSASIVDSYDIGHGAPECSQRRPYRPFGIKKRFLGSILIVALGCTALLELAIRSGKPVPVLGPKPASISIGQQRREATLCYTATTVVTVTVGPLSDATESAQPTTSSACPPNAILTLTVTIHASNYIATVSASPSLSESSYHTAPSVYITNESAKPAASEVRTPTITVPASQYIATVSASPSLSKSSVYTDQSAYVAPNSATESEVVSPTITKPASQYIATGPISVSASESSFHTAPSAYITNESAESMTASEVSSPTLTKPASQYIATDSTSPSPGKSDSDQSITATGYTAPSAYITDDSASRTTVSKTAPSVYNVDSPLNSATPSEIVSGTSTGPPSHYITTGPTSERQPVPSTTPRTAYTSAESAYIHMPTTVKSPTPSNGGVSSMLQSSESQHTTTFTNSPASYTNPNAMTASQVIGSTPSLSYLEATETESSAAQSSDSNTPGTTSTPGHAAITSYVSQDSSPNSNSLTTIKHQLQIIHSYHRADYFLAMYLAIIVAVAIEIAWTIVFASAKMMEPFYQMSRSDVPSAQDSLCVTYLSSTLSPTSLSYLFQSGWTMMLTSLVYLLMGLLAPLASEAMRMYAIDWCKQPAGYYQRCTGVWAIDIRITRALQALLFLCAALTFLLLVLYWRRRSNVTSNPSTIAYVASLLQDREVLSDLRQLNPSASKRVLGRSLAENHYGLQLDPYGQGYCLLKSITDKAPNESTRSSINFLPNQQHEYEPVNSTHQITSARANHKYRGVWDLCYLGFTLGFLGVIIANFLEYRDTAFNRFINSGGFGPRFFLSIVATIVDDHWKSLEREVRIVTPYRRLALGNASAKDTILATINGTPYTSVGSALWRRNWFHAFIAVVAVLSDILIIAVAGIPYSDAQYWLALLVSSYVSFGILGIMVIALVAIIIWRERNAKLALPRPASTVLSVALTLCGDDDSVRRNAATILETTNCRRRQTYLAVGEQRTYSAGWIRECDGRERWTIVEESREVS